MREKSFAFRAFMVVVAVVMCAVGYFAAPFPGLSEEGFTCLFVVLAIIVLWCTEAIPVLVVCAVTVVLVPSFGLLTVSETWAASGSNGFFFVLAAFGIAAGMSNTNIPKYMVAGLLKITGNHVERIVAGFVVMTAFLSLFVIDSAACVMATFSLGLIEASGEGPSSKGKLGKALMIGIPFGAYCGGIAFPSSSIVNIFAITALNQFGYEITYLQWAAVGFPLAVVSTLIVALILPKLFKLEPLTDEQFAAVKAEAASCDKFSARDAKMLIIFAGMVLFWVFSDINMVVVACAGVALMFCPGIDIVDGESYSRMVNPVSLSVIAAIMVMVAAVQGTDLSDWIVSSCFSGVSAWPALLVLLMMGLVSTVMHTLLPAGAACLTVTSLVMFPVAASVGMSVGGVAVLLSFWCTALFLLPLDPLYLMTYGYGYYSFGDVLKVGAPTTLVMLIVTAVIVYSMSLVTGLA